MPHGQSTRLGSSLGFVLANFCRQSQPHNAVWRFLRPARLSLRSCNATRTRKFGSATTSEAKEDDLHQLTNADGSRVSTSKTRLLRVHQVLTKGVKRVGGSQYVEDTAEFAAHSPYPTSRPGSDRCINLPIRPDGLVNSRYSRSQLISFSSILSRCMHEHETRVWQNMDGEHSAPELNETEWRFLADNGSGPEHIQICLNILRTPNVDSALAKLHLQNQVSMPGDSFLAVLGCILQTKPFTSRALKSALVMARTGLDERVRDRSHNTNWGFLLFTRLLGLARDIWPVAIIDITELMLKNLPRLPIAPITEFDHVRYQDLTRKLNKALHLISMPTALEPYKDAPYQEEALVLVLRYMAEHNPTLQLNRAGYRSVVALQLTYGKTPKERQWAQLKALSWPPWKADRTQMDTAITPEMGITRAGRTLRRMREAGYGARLWEEIAQLYTGWDTDRTPTIQTRVLMRRSLACESQSALWVARITTTRTIQEAWAAYLAYEQSGIEGIPDQQVVQAILQKLYLERERYANEAQESTPARCQMPEQQPVDTVQRLLPGDSRAVSPLPPSSHLFTYTRVPPPTLAEFYRHLQRQHVILGLNNFAFLVSNASSLQQGEIYLHDAESSYPGVKYLFWHSPNKYQLTQVPAELFRAYITLLCRFPRMPLRNATEWKSIVTVCSPVSLEINRNNALGYAIYLLYVANQLSRITINAVLKALSKESTAKVVTSILNFNNAQLVGHTASTACYALARELIQLLSGNYQELDKYGFSHFCRILENSLVAGWESAILKNNTVRPKPTSIVAMLPPDRQDAIDHLQDLFQKLTGGLNVSDLNTTCIYNPGPKVWHDLIRVLGLTGDHERLLPVVQHMCKQEAGLSGAIRRDRNGSRMAERASIAIRVFLERSWLADLGRCKDSINGKMTEHSHVVDQLAAVASVEIIHEVESLLSQSKCLMWPTDTQVKKYWQANSKLVRLRNMYAEV